MTNEITFTKKQADVILILISDIVQDIEDDEEDALDTLEQSDVGAYLDTLSDDELAHYGVLGMKWGLRRGTRKADKLERQSRALERKFERGGNVTRGALRRKSQLYRKYSYQTTKRIRKITQYLQRDAAWGMTVSNRFIKIKHDPEELKKAKQYLADSETLRERYRDIGARLDSLKLDALM